MIFAQLLTQSPPTASSEQPTPSFLPTCCTLAEHYHPALLFATMHAQSVTSQLADRTLGRARSGFTTYRLSIVIDLGRSRGNACESSPSPPRPPPAAEVGVRLVGPRYYHPVQLLPALLSTGPGG